VTHGIFGIEKSIAIDLIKFSSNTIRNNKIAYVTFKKKDQFMGYYFIDKRNSKFKEKILFDHIICLKR
jgi:hypothetical protein